MPAFRERRSARSFGDPLPENERHRRLLAECYGLGSVHVGPPGGGPAKSRGQRERRG